jgi:hypothetical protein
MGRDPRNNTNGPRTYTKNAFGSCFFVFCFGVISWIVSAAYGQGTATPGTRGRADPVQLEMQRRLEADAIEKLLAARPQPSSDREHREILNQIRKDFLRIQVVNDNLRQQATRADHPDLGLIAESAADIKRCAARLKENLSLPKVETVAEGPKNASEDQLLELLSGLSRSIDAFVGNPVFESAKVVNPSLSFQASRNLEEIIEASKEIRKLSERRQRK